MTEQGPVTRVAVLDDYQEVARTYGPWEGLGAALEVDVYSDHLDDPAALAERLAPYSVVVAMRERTTIDRELLARLPALRLLVTTGMHNAAIDIKACAAQGVTVCGTGGVAHGTPELTWALILAAARHVPAEVANVRSGGWMTTVGSDLCGARLGVLGLGRIGSRVARIGLAFGMEVVAWSEHLTDERCGHVGVVRVTKDELFATADFLTIHLVLSERTRGLVGRSELEAMQSSAWLVNTSRGPICDEAALAEACRSRTIAGACLDVYGTEPLPVNHLFRTLDNVIATPHIGYVTDQTYRVFWADVVEDIERWLVGDPVRMIPAL